MPPINAIIVEDMPIAQQHLKKMLDENCPQVNVVATYSSAREAIQHLANLNYDLLFLDIEYNDGYNAFRMLEDLDFHETHIIFTTAYEKYRKEANDLDAIKYLLKPIKQEELIKAVERSMQIKIGKERLADIEKRYRATKAGKLVINSEGISYFIAPEEIVYLEASGTYTSIHFQTNNGLESTLSSRNLGKFEQLLAPHNFVRVHKKYLVNISCIKTCKRTTLMLSASNQTIEISISKDRRKAIIDSIALKNLEL